MSDILLKLEPHAFYKDFYLKYPMVTLFLIYGLSILCTAFIIEALIILSRNSLNSVHSSAKNIWYNIIVAPLAILFPFALALPVFFFKGGSGLTPAHDLLLLQLIPICLYVYFLRLKAINEINKKWKMNLSQRQ